jgi:TonB-linked SusC/RagA family outer membrane protein
MKKFMLLLVALLFAGSQMLQAQRTITGTVISAEDNQGIPGVQVLVKGTTTGTTTNVNGQYSLSVPANATTLVFSFMGMATQEREIGGDTRIDVVMESSATALEGVIITGYGNIKRSTYTGSAEVVGSDIIERSQASNVTKALEGVIPGVQTVGNSGQPGSGMTVRIRGVGSVYANNAPLYVLDGAPYDGDISSINPDDIENISVLKDATSAALYGARGANGVIIITTKRGRGEARLNFRATYGITTRGIPEYDVLDAKEYYEALFTSLTNQYMTQGDSKETAYQKAAGLTADGVLSKVGFYNAFNVPNNQLFDPATGKVNTGSGYRYEESWEDVMIKPAKRQEYLISGTKGDANNNIFASIGYVDEAGMLDQTGFKRLTARLNTSNQLKKWIKLEMGLGGTRQETKNNNSDETNNMINPFSSIRNTPAIFPVYQYDMATGKKMYDEFGKPLWDFGGQDGMSPGTTGRPYNPNDNVAILHSLNERNRQVDALNARLALEFNIIDGLSLRLQGSADMRNLYGFNWGNREYGTSAGYGGTLGRWQEKTFSNTLTQMLNYNKTFAGKHSVAAVAGHESYSYNFQYLYAYKEGFPWDTREMALGTEVKSATSYHDNLRLEGYFLNINYDFDGKYHGSFSLRRDGSSRFHPDTRWGNFWSFGAAWIVSREDFMSSVSFVDVLKLRASYGAQGNEPTGYYPWMGLFTLTNYNQRDLTGAMHLSLDAPLLSWESQKMFNVGVDFILFKKLSGSIEYYSRNNSDMLFRRPLPPSTGIRTVWQNFGQMKTNGFEFQANYDIISSKDFKWSVGLNATHWNNKMVKMAASDSLGIASGNQRIQEGHSVYEFYMREFAGVNERGQALYYKADNLRGTQGLDRNNTTTVLSEASFYWQDKTSTPKVYGGFTTTVEYKGFDLSVLCSYSLGGYMQDGYYERLMHMGFFNGNNLHKDILKSWTPENQSQEFPMLNEQWATNNYGGGTSRYLVSGSYFNLKNVTLGYTIPNNLTQKIKIESVRAFITLDNFWLKSARKGMDPQHSMAGQPDFARYFPTKTITFGIQAQL